MLDIRRLRNHFEEVKQALSRRKEDFNLDAFKILDEKRRKLLQEVEQLKSKQNTVSKQIPMMKKEGKDVKDILDQMKELSDQIKNLNQQLKEVDEQLEYVLLTIPNIPHPSVPEGETDEDNVEIRKWKEVPDFSFDAKAH